MPSTEATSEHKSSSGWKEVILRVKNEIAQDRLNLISAGVAFYAFLALFPALAAVISVWGFFADPNAVQEQIAGLSGTVPASVRDLMSAAATRIARSSPTSLGLGVIGSFLLTLWSANKGMKGLVEGVNVAYDEDPAQRGFFRKNGLSLVLTLGAILMVILALALVVALPVAVRWLGLPGWAQTLVGLARWPILTIFVLAALAVVYRVSPVSTPPPSRWVTPGAIVATVLWLAASIGFSYYTANFGSYDKTYGSLGAVAIMLLWFFISAFTVLIGAEINAENEKQMA